MARSAVVLSFSLPQQHVDQVARAKALAGAVAGCQRLYGGLGAVPGLDRLQAGVAIAALTLMRLAEMGENRLPAAAGAFADPQQRIELGALDPL